jgi:hypothetical protein
MDARENAISFCLSPMNEEAEKAPAGELWRNGKEIEHTSDRVNSRPTT